MRTEAITIVAFAATEKGAGFGRRPFFVVRSHHGPSCQVHGHEIVVTRPGTDMMTAYRKRPIGRT